MQKDYTRLVEEFHSARGETRTHQPTGELDARVMFLRVRLICSELGELVDAMDSGDVVRIADALADLSYVVHGTAVAYELSEVMDAVFREVHRSNMTKDHRAIASGQKYGPHGKGEFYEPPRILEALAGKLSFTEGDGELCARCRGQLPPRASGGHVSSLPNCDTPGCNTPAVFIDVVRRKAWCSGCRPSR